MGSAGYKAHIWKGSFKFSLHSLGSIARHTKLSSFGNFVSLIRSLMTHRKSFMTLVVFSDELVAKESCALTQDAQARHLGHVLADPLHLGV